MGSLALADSISKIIKKLIPDKDLRAKLSTEIETSVLSVQDKLIDGRVKIMLAEMSSQSWMARNWRPAYMWLFLVILFNNMLLYPYFDFAVEIEVPERMWRFMEITAGLYMGMRTYEKTKKSKSDDG